MAADSNAPAWIITFVLFSLLVSVSVSSAQTIPSMTQTKPPDRGQCIDGTYKHNGWDCCLCAAGQKLVEHCTANLQFGKCELCDDKTYNSHPTKEDSCEPCRSCTHRSGKLEYDKTCTPVRNAKCRCQKGYYCISGTESCEICHPCKECGAEGIKIACTGKNNTVCNDKIEGGNQVGLIVGILFAVVLLIGAVVGLLIWRRRQRRLRQLPSGALMNGNNGMQEMQPLNVLPDVDLQRFLPDIAGAIGWKDMQDIAMRIGIPNTTIDSCKLNNPGDADEQTLQLLKVWVERQGSGASKSLIEILQTSGKRAKAEKVRDILTGRSNLPV